MELLAIALVVCVALAVIGLLAWRVLDDAKKVQSDALELLRDVAGIQQYEAPATPPPNPRAIWTNPEDGSMVVLDPTTGAPMIVRPNGTYAHADGSPVDPEHTPAPPGEWKMEPSDDDLPFTDPTYLGANPLDNVGFGDTLPPDIAEAVASGDDGRGDRAQMIRPGENPYKGLAGIGDD